jgi:hypothetical protein
MEIRIDPHTLERAEERGATEQEIRETIETGELTLAKKNRLGRAKVYAFNQTRRGKFFEQKRIEVFYVIEGGAIVTVTVYVFYGKWESERANLL